MKLTFTNALLQKRFLYVVALLLLSTPILHAQNTLALAIGGQGDDQGRALVQTADGGYVIAGSTTAAFGKTDAYFTKINSAGVTQWTRIVGGTDDDNVHSLIKTLDGGFAATGSTKSFGNNGEVYVIKLSSTGAVEWTRAVGTVSGAEGGEQILQIADSSYVIGGNTTVNGSDMYIVKLSSSGAFQWDRKVGQLAGANSVTDIANSITEAHGGGYVIAGYTYYYTGNISTSSNDFYAVKVDASGNFVWGSILHDPFGTVGMDLGKSITKTTDGGYAMVGEFARLNSGGGSYNTKYGLVKLNGNGSIRWTRGFGTPTNDNNARWIIETRDLGLAVIGAMTHPSLGLREQYLVKFDSSGSYQWNKTFGSTVYGDWLATPRKYPDSNEGYGIVETADTGIAVAGYLADGTGGGGDQEIHFVKFDAGITNCYTTSLLGDPLTVNGNLLSTGGAAAANGASRAVADTNATATWSVIDFCNLSLTVNVSPVNAKCKSACNGKAIAEPRQGTAPFSYTWNTNPVQNTDTATGLCAGTYIVTVTDNASLTASASVTIGEPTQLTATAATSGASCGGSTGQATATGTGGTTQYTYSWNSTPAQTTKIATGLPAGTYTVIITDAQQCTASASATIASGTPPIANVTTTPAACNLNNGSATANASGGTGSTYTYSWNSSPAQSTKQAQNLGVGTYVVTVTDSTGCSVTASGTVTSTGGSLVASVTISATPTAVCAGGMVRFTATPVNGGTVPSYQWKVNGTNVWTDSSNFYTTTLNNNDQVTVIMTSTAPCVTGSPDTSDAVGITVYPAANAGTLTAVPDSICQGSSSALALTGSNAPVQWQSSLSATNFSNIPAATSTSYNASPTQTTYYRAYASNANCSDTTAAFRLVVLPNPVVPLLTSTDSIICASDSAQICAADYFVTYKWNNGSQSNCTYAKNAGGYWVSVTDANGCSAISGRKNLAIYAVPSVSIIVQGDTLYSFGAVAYQWFLNGVKIEGATQAKYIATQSGNYSIEITDANGCKALSSPVTYTGIDQVTLEKSIDIFPNPATGVLNIRYQGDNQGAFQVLLYNVLGEQVMNTNMILLSGRTVSLDVSVYARGIYFVQLRSGESSISKKIIIN